MHIMLLQKVTEMPFCFEHDKQYITCELRPPMSRPPYVEILAPPLSMSTPSLNPIMIPYCRADIL
jgi:hypothetical protein